MRCGKVSNLAEINLLQQWIGFQAGITDRFNLFSYGTFSYTFTENDFAQDSLQVGARYRFSEAGRLPVDIGIIMGYLLEHGRTSVLQAGGILSRDIERLNLISNIQFEKAFAKFRDDIDMYITAGASYRIFDWFKIGIEYAGQDLEDLWEEEEAEGGARHIIGPAAAFQFNKGASQLILSPALVLSSTDEGTLLRLLFSQTF